MLLVVLAFVFNITTYHTMFSLQIDAKQKKRALVEVDQEILDTQVNPSMWKNMIAFKNLNGKLIAKRQYPYIQGFGNSPGNV